MGKAQSKRSVDITTETKKGPDGGDEVTGKLEKIEDIDQKQVNGDATPQEKNDAAGEKKDAPDETENEKDMTTEKPVAESTATPTAPTTGGGGDQPAESSPKEDASPKEDVAAAEQAKEGEEISPLADESVTKKSKKEKLKNKWSFRKISFGKKDKQKPAKTEGSDNAAAAATATATTAENTTNGDASETNKPADETAKKDETAAVKVDDAAAKSVEVESGAASVKEQQQLNGQKTPTPTNEPIEKSSVVVNETATTKNTNTTVTIPSPATVVAAAKSSIEIIESHSEIIKGTIEKVEAIVSNGTADAEKNGIMHDTEGKQNNDEKITAQSEEIIKSIPIDEKPHQNGTNGDEAAIDELTAATKTLQIEVKTVHQIDSVNSTTNTITTNSTSDTTNITSTTTTTTIPTENFNTDQTTTNDKLYFTTSAQTDINTNTNNSTTSTITNTTNTSDKSLSSTKSIILSEEQPLVNQPEKLLDTKKEFENEIEVAIEQTADSKPIQPNEQQIPPPLPLTAPPSQVAIFALKDNENSDDNSLITSKTDVENIESLLLKVPTDELITAEVIEIVETTIMKDEGITALSIQTTTTDDDKVQMPMDVDDICTMTTEEMETEKIEVIPAEELSHKTIEKDITIGVVDDDFAAAALEIVDQIQKDLEKEDDDSQQQQQQESENYTNSNDGVVETINLINVGNNIENVVGKDQQEEAPKKEIALTPQCNNMIELSLPISTSAIIVEEQKVQHKIVVTELSNEQGNNYEQNTEEMINENQNTLESETTTTTTQLNDESNVLINADDNNMMMTTMTINVIDINNKVVAHDHDEVEDNEDDKEDKDEDENELIVSSNKEIPNAKDLKENAAAAEITTQDLPVTCE